MPNSIVPITVKTDAEFQAAVRLKRTAIIIDNKEIEDVIKKAVEKSSGFSTASSIGSSAGLLGLAAFFAIPAVGAGVLLASAAATVIGSVLGCGQAIIDGLVNYAIIEDTPSNRMVLIRVDGKNAIKKGDTIQGIAFEYSRKNLKKKMKEIKKTREG